MDYKNWERSIDLFLETIDDTCPLLKKNEEIVAGEKQKQQQGEEDEVKILYLDSRCPARAALPEQ